MSAHNQKIKKSQEDSSKQDPQQSMIIQQQERSNSEETDLFNGDDCIICQEKYTDWYILPCYHKFDIECLIELKIRICPLCRSSIDEYNEIERRYLLTHESLPKNKDIGNLFIGNNSFFPS